MKIPKGVTIHIGKKKYSGEIPDNLVTDELKNKYASGKIDNKKSASKEEPIGN